jgi:hypothetical protein
MNLRTAKDKERGSNRIERWEEALTKTIGGEDIPFQYATTRLFSLADFRNRVSLSQAETVYSVEAGSTYSWLSATSAQVKTRTMIFWTYYRALASGIVR